MSLQLHRPDGKGGLEVRAGTEQNYRSTLRSPRWGAALRGGRLPELANPEMNPTSTARSVAFWVVLGAHHLRADRGGLRIGPVEPRRRLTPEGNLIAADGVRGAP